MRSPWTVTCWLWRMAPLAVEEGADAEDEGFLRGSRRKQGEREQGKQGKPRMG